MAHLVQLSGEEIVGIRAGWVCVRGLAKAEVFERLGLEEAEETGSWMDFNLSGAELQSGWVVVVTPEGELPPRADLEALSATGEVFTCEISDTVMHSIAEGYSAGRFVWSVEHDVGRKAGIYDLVAEGELPSAFAEIEARLVAQQDAEGGEEAGVDYIFGAPMDLVYALCGFRADGETMADEPQMTLLERAEGSAAPGKRSGKSFLGWLFGRG